MMGAGVPPSGSGHSAEPETCSTVSAETASVPNATIAAMNDFIARAGNGAKTLMVSPPAYDELRAHSDPRDWLWWHKQPALYRSASVNIHDEWSWGWMVRKADGSFVERASAIEARSDATGTGAAEGESAVAKPDAKGPSA